MRSSHGSMLKKKAVTWRKKGVKNIVTNESDGRGSGDV